MSRSSAVRTMGLVGEGNDMMARIMIATPTWLAIWVLGFHSWGCTGIQRSKSRCSPIDGRQDSGRNTQTSGTVREAVRKTMAEARQAVTELGVTDAAMNRIREALARLAKQPGLKEEFTLRKLHGGGASAAL